ncbi:amidohydrolase family protein [Streptomyces sp. NPDC051907]|uniref:amidohydrolase family protein n=1 Tax=Streptomyces sp. NPDC051907 TaxID=3155284 RepID=UPI003438481E
MPTRRHVLGTAAALTGTALISAAAATSATAASTAKAAKTATAAAGAQRPARRGDLLALTHATVVEGNRATPDQTLLVQDGRIVRSGPSAHIVIPRAARTVDLRGKYVIPGLIESHAHTTGPDEVAAPVFPLAGVTAVREMWGAPAHHERRQKVAAGKLLGPHWTIASPIVDGPPTLFTQDTGNQVIEARDEASARRAVREAKRSGADFVKVYSRLTRPAYLALADEARRQGIRFAGHCPDSMTVAECSDAGQQTIEHLHALLLATSSKEEEIRRRLAEVRIDPNEPSSLARYNAWFRQVHELEYEAVRSYDPVRARALFERLAANGTRVVPTLSVHHALERPEEIPARQDEARYVPSGTADSWPATWEALTGGRTPREATRIRQIYAHRLRLVAEMHRAGVEVLAGTDTGTGYLVPGFSLHDEMALLAEAGLPAHRVLESATTAPARMLGLDDRRADLVVLDANPLDDIRNTRCIDSVVVAGRHISRAERGRLLAQVEQAAAASRPPATTAAPASALPLRPCC